MKIHFLHTNDIHSQIDQYVRLGHRLRSLRTQLQAESESVLTLDMGDLLDRVRPETEATMGEINAALMRSLAYDGWVFGNNEGLTISPQLWPRLVEQANVNLFCANLQQAEDRPFAFMQETDIRRFGSVLVGLFALTPNYHRAYTVLGVSSCDPIPRAQHCVKTLREAGAQVIVCMSHLGLHEDHTLAQAVSGIDLILGGHTHQSMEYAEWEGQTAIFQPGKHAQAFGHSTITFDEQQGRICDVTCRRILIDVQGPLDQQMAEVRAAYTAQVTRNLQRPIVQLTEALAVQYTTDSPFANLVADALLERFPADFSVVMAGALTASMLPGIINHEHILGACSTPTRPIRMTMLGRDIQSFLHKAIQAEYYGKLGYGYGFRGSVVGYLAMSNVTVSIKRHMGRTELKQVLIDGQPLDPEQPYRLVTSEYLWLSPTFSEFQNATDIAFERPLLREVLIDAMSDPLFVQRSRPTRYHLF